MTAVNYLWNPINDNIVEEFDDAGNTIAEYTTEPDQFGDVVSQFRDGQESFYHTDGQGSTLALTNANGDLTDTYAYSAFGDLTARTGSTMNPFQYIGQKQYYNDVQTEAYEIRRRPMVFHGRWLTKDPVYFIALDDPNTYLYVGNLCIQRVDPSGLAPPVPCICDPDAVYGPGYPWEVLRYPPNEPFKTKLVPPVEGAPWQDFELIDPDPTKAIEYGQTQPIIFSKCFCAECDWLKSFCYEVMCQMAGLLIISIDVKKAKDRGKSVDGIYGHEQLHVKNWHEFWFPGIKSLWDPVLTESRCRLTRNECEIKAREIDRDVRKDIDEAIRRESEHYLAVPIKGTPYPPIGKVPPPYPKKRK